jgi:hypothetical protein
MGRRWSPDGAAPAAAGRRPPQVSVGEGRPNQRVSRCRPTGVDIGERGPGQGFGRFLAARLLLGHARIGLCVLARRQRLGVIDGFRRGLRDGSVGILLRRRALLN